MTNQLKDLVQELDTLVEKAKNNKTTANYQLIQLKINEMDGLLRECYQTVTEEEMIEIVRKLKLSEPLTPKEINLVRRWVVGDAEAYLSMEKNFPVWIDLLSQLVDQLKTTFSTDTNLPSPERLDMVRGINKIALRLLPNINYYIAEKERVAAFERAVSDGIDSEEAKGYCDMLIEKLQRHDI